MGRKSRSIKKRKQDNKKEISKNIRKVQAEAEAVKDDEGRKAELQLSANIEAKFAELLALNAEKDRKKLFVERIMQGVAEREKLAKFVESKKAELREKGLLYDEDHNKENYEENEQFPSTVFIYTRKDPDAIEAFNSEMGNTTTSTCSSSTSSQQIKGQIKVLKPEAPFSSEQDYAKYSNLPLQLLNQIGHHSKNTPHTHIYSSDCSTTAELGDIHSSTTMGSVGGSGGLGAGAGSLSSSSRSREQIHYNNSVSLKHKNPNMDINSRSNASGSGSASVQCNNTADGGNHLIPNSKTPPKYFFNCRDDDKDTEIIYKRGVRVGHNKERFEMDSNSQESSYHSNSHQLETLNPDYALYSDRVLNGNIESRTEYDTNKFKGMRGPDSQASTSSGGVSYNNIKDSSDPSSSSPTEAEIVHKGSPLYQNSSGEKRPQKKSAKNAKEKRTTDIDVTEIPGFRGRDNIDSIIEYIDGGNGAGESKRVGRKDNSHRDHRSKSNEKELLVKSVSLDDDSFASPSVRPMSERTTAGGSNREIVKRQKNDHHITSSLTNTKKNNNNNNNPRTTSPDQIKENSISPTPSSTTLDSTTSTTTKVASQPQTSVKEPSNIAHQHQTTTNVSQVSSQAPQKSLMTHNKQNITKEPKEVAVVKNNSSTTSNVSSTKHPNNSKPSNSSKFAQDDNNKDKDLKEALEEKHEFTEFRTVTRKNKFKNKNKDNSSSTINTSSASSGGGSSSNSSAATLVNSHNNNNNNNNNSHHTKDTSSSGGNVPYASGGSNNKGANNHHQTSSSSLVNIASSSSPARPASSTSSSPDLAFPPLLVNSVQPPVLNTIQTRDWVNVCVGGESKSKQTPPASSSNASHPPLPSPSPASTTSSKATIEEVQTPPLANSIIINSNNPNPNSSKSNSARKSQQQQQQQQQQLQQAKCLSDNKNSGNNNNNNNNVKNNKNSNASGVVFVSNSNNDNTSGRESNVNVSAPHNKNQQGQGDTQQVHHHTKSYSNNDNSGAQPQPQQHNPAAEVDIGPVVFCGENFKEQPAQIPVDFGFTFGFNNDVQDILRASGGNNSTSDDGNNKSGGGNPPLQKIKAESDDGIDKSNNSGWIQLGPGSDINQYYTSPPPPSVGSDQPSFNPLSCQNFMDKYAADLLNESSGHRRKQVIHRI